MECEITDNQTRYPNEDILAVCTAVREAVLYSFPDIDWLYPEQIRVRSWSPSQSTSPGLDGVKVLRSEPFYYRYGYSNNVVLTIVAPKHLPENDPIRSLVHSVDGKVYLPKTAVGAIARWYLSQCYLAKSLRKDFIENLDLPEVSVQERRVNPVKTVKKSTAGKIESYIEKHGDPDYAMKGSSRTPDYRWKYELHEMKDYYDREWERRDKWRQKILKLGGEREAHIDFAAYLVFVGKYHQKHGRFPW